MALQDNTPTAPQEATEFPRGAELARQVMNKILENPSCWDQSQWHCGTTHCFGGWCQIVGGRKQSDDARFDAEELLGLSRNESNWLFHSRRTLGELYGFTKSMMEWEAENGFNRAGFDRDGFDRDGFNRAGDKLPLLQPIAKAKGGAA